MQEHPFEVDIGHLIDVLAERLYTDPRVAIRELISNARDGLLKRWGTNTREGRIDIGVGTGTLSITDNGPGMTEQEIREGLARVAGSLTRILRRKDSGAEDWVKWLSGDFGIGFFASFMLAYGVEVRTRPAVGGEKGWVWRCFGGQKPDEEHPTLPSSWTLERTACEQAGTTVTLYLKGKYWGLLDNPAEIERLVIRYADLVEFPIYVSGRVHPVNRQKGPWADTVLTTEQAEHYLRRRGILKRDQSILTVIPIQEGDDLEGMLFLVRPPRPDGSIELHSRHIFVGEDKTCLPEHLGFLSGVLDCRNLPLTMNRQTVLEGSELEELRAILRKVFLGHLQSLSSSRQKEFYEVVRSYGRELRIAAAEDEELLRLVGHTFTVRVGLGRDEMTFAQVLQRTADSKCVYFMDDPETQGQYADLRMAQGIPVVALSDHLDLRLLHRFAELHGKEIARVDTGADVEETSEPGWEEVEQLLCSVDETIACRQARLPENIAALFRRTQEDLLDEYLDKAETAGVELPPDIDRIKKLRKLWKSVDPPRRVLYINIRHPLLLSLKKACTQGVDHTVLQKVARALLEAARLSGESLGFQARLRAHSTFTVAYGALLDELTSGGRGLAR